MEKRKINKEKAVSCQKVIGRFQAGKHLILLFEACWDGFVGKYQECILLWTKYRKTNTVDTNALNTTNTNRFIEFPEKLRILDINEFSYQWCFFLKRKSFLQFANSNKQEIFIQRWLPPQTSSFRNMHNKFWLVWSAMHLSGSICNLQTIKLEQELTNKIHRIPMQTDVSRLTPKILFRQAKKLSTTADSTFKPFHSFRTIFPSN